MNKKIAVATAVIAALAIGGLWLKHKPEADSAYVTEAVSTGSIEATVTATGTVNPRTSVQVGTQVSGTIQSLHADYNSNVSQGELLAQIDPATFQAQVDQASASLIMAQASLTKAQIAKQEAGRNLRRNNELFKKNFIARSDLDDSETAYDNALAQVESARAQIAQSRASLSQSQTNLRNTHIISPVKGTVISRSVEVGQIVAASFSTPTLFTIAADLTKMQIDTNVDEADIGKIAIGQPVRFSVDAHPEDEFEGSVAEIRNAPTTVENVVTYDVIVNVANPQLKLKPGMTANVTIVTDSKPQTLKVSNAALRFKPENSPKHLTKGPGVWILSNDKPKRLSVKTGISDGSFTEVSGSGIKAGLPVIVESNEGGGESDGSSSKAGRRMGGPGMMH